MKIRQETGIAFASRKTRNDQGYEVYGYEWVVILLVVATKSPYATHKSIRQKFNFCMIS